MNSGSLTGCPALNQATKRVEGVRAVKGRTDQLQFN